MTGKKKKKKSHFKCYHSVKNVLMDQLCRLISAFSVLRHGIHTLDIRVLQRDIWHRFLLVFLTVTAAITDSMYRQASQCQLRCSM